MNARHIVHKIAANYDINFDGLRDHDITVSNDKFYSEIAKKGSLGLGEAYMDGLWTCRHLDQFFNQLLRKMANQTPDMTPVKTKLQTLLYKFLNQQTIRKSRKVAIQHYNLGNDLYQLMLDPEMSYSCGYWQNANSLAEAQYNKLDLICRKLNLKPGNRVLDIGCGWGSFARHAAKHYGCKVIGVTISKEQQILAQSMSNGLDIEFRLEDYRLLTPELSYQMPNSDYQSRLRKRRC